MKSARVLIVSAACLGPASALAQTAPGPTAAAPVTATAPAPAPPAPPGIVFNAQIEGGITGYPAADAGSNNAFGQLFTDHTNQPELNQILLTVSRTIDPKQTDFDVGFRLQGMYGSDVRYTKYLGEFDQAISDRDQFQIVEASVSFHLPIITDGGVDAKIGQFPTLLGYETIDPSTNPFYSHSYMFNFGIPFEHTGGYAITHVNSVFDFYIGFDTGEQTTFGRGSGDNNGAAAGMGGFNLTLLGGNLTMLALTHIGAENSYLTTPNASSHLRYENDAVITYKATPKVTLTTDLNFIRDDYYRADAGGVAEYAAITLNDHLTFNARAELYRDDRGFFVASFPGNNDFIRAERGDPAPNVVGGGNTGTYGELTIGVTYKPKVPGWVANLMIRPELRFDQSLTHNNPYNGGRDPSAITLASDVVLGF